MFVFPTTFDSLKLVTFERRNGTVNMGVSHIRCAKIDNLFAEFATFSPKDKLTKFPNFCGSIHYSVIDDTWSLEFVKSKTTPIFKSSILESVYTLV